MIGIRMFVWACSLVFIAWAISQAAGNITPEDYLVWLGAMLVGVVLFGMATAELGLCFLEMSTDEEKP